MIAWGICSTLNAPAEQVAAFVAHHLGLGAARIWLHFDDPDDPAARRDWGERVEVTRCDDGYWRALYGRRPVKHQVRQAQNMQRVYRLAALPWVAHIDVDEFLQPEYEIGSVLERVPLASLMLRLAPWEALQEPGLPDDIFTARHFRAALTGAGKAGVRGQVFGEFAGLLPDGVLSHSAGKCFFRTGTLDLEPRIHGAFLGGARVKGGDFSPDIALLHFHAEDPVRWKERLNFRLTKGAYQFNPALRDWLLKAGPEGVDRFYQAVQVADPGMLKALDEERLLKIADLRLREKAARFLV